MALANIATLDGGGGGGGVAEIETGKFSLAGADLGGALTTNLRRITYASFTAVQPTGVVKTDANSANTNQLFIGTDAGFVGTATGSAFGLVVTGGTVSVARIGTSEDNELLYYLYRLEGQS